MCILPDIIPCCNYYVPHILVILVSCSIYFLMNDPVSQVCLLSINVLSEVLQGGVNIYICMCIVMLIQCFCLLKSSNVEGRLFPSWGLPETKH